MASSRMIGAAGPGQEKHLTTEFPFCPPIDYYALQGSMQRAGQFSSGKGEVYNLLLFTAFTTSNPNRNRRISLHQDPIRAANLANSLPDRILGCLAISPWH